MKNDANQLDLFAPEPPAVKPPPAVICQFTTKDGELMVVTERLSKEDFRALLGKGDGGSMLFLSREEILDYVAEPELRRTVRAALKDAPLP